MKRAICLLTLVFAFPLLGDEPSEKRRLVSRLLEVIDAKALMRMSFGPVSEGDAVAERLFAHVDSVKYLDAIYVPLFEEQFTNDELRSLIEFFETKHGQKLAAVLPRLTSGGDASMRLLDEAAEAAKAELARELAAKEPWRVTMMDLRSLAVAVESRATDENEYPDVAFEELESLIAPTYIHEVPKVDAWGTPFFYVADGERYRFVSAGADRRFEWSARRLDRTIAEPRLTDDLDADIIFQDGIFVQSPRVAAEHDD